MRFFAILLVLLSSFPLWQGRAQTVYPEKHIRYVDSYEFRQMLQDSSNMIMTVFTNGDCLSQSNSSSGCFQFVRKLDYFGKAIEARHFNMIGVDVSFFNRHLISRYSIRKLPSVIIFDRHNGGEIARFEPRDHSDELPRGQYFPWQNDLVQRILDSLKHLSF